MLSQPIAPLQHPQAFSPVHHLSHSAFSLDPSSQASLPTQQSTLASTEGWVLDTGATNHFSPSLDSMSLVLPYQGKSQVIVSSGRSVPILNVGKKILYTNPKPLHLNQVFHTPGIP